MWVIPVLVGVFVLGIQFAMWCWCRDQALQAAQIALAGSRGYQASAGVGQSQAQTYLQGQDGTVAWLGSPTITVDRGDQVTTVEVSGDFTSIIPVLPLDVHVTAQGPTEVLTAPGGAP